ncbi:bacteriocin [Echinicola salinicaeni]|uniref:bacteriocin n=1 Tax=Echinicola salinicaeni TaxID=2762757 RepID=UPI001646B605|nr:bacteriocin [Echinicola salinicaeni]
MEFKELNQNELKNINGGFLGGLFSEEGGSQGSLIGGLSLHFSNASMDEDGEMSQSSFGIELSDIGSFQNLFND